MKYSVPANASRSLWAETVTRVAETGVPDADYEAAAAEFSDKELADLTYAIGLMNAFNRLSISFRVPRLPPSKVRNAMGRDIEPEVSSSSQRSAHVTGHDELRPHLKDAGSFVRQVMRHANMDIVCRQRGMATELSGSLAIGCRKIFVWALRPCRRPSLCSRVST